MSNDTQTLTLTEFLLARITEDEVTARHADVYLRSLHRHDSSPGLSVEGNRVWAVGRALAECEAKRQIVAAHPMMDARPSTLGHLLTADGRKVSPYYRDGCCETCTAWGEYGGPADAETGEVDYCPTLRILGAIYADHPDFREEWRP